MEMFVLKLIIILIIPIIFLLDAISSRSESLSDYIDERDSKRFKNIQLIKHTVQLCVSFNILL
jgi:uncharacterized membrane protein